MKQGSGVNENRGRVGEQPLTTPLPAVSLATVHTVSSHSASWKETQGVLSAISLWTEETVLLKKVCSRKCVSASITWRSLARPKGPKEPQSGVLIWWVDGGVRQLHNAAEIFSSDCTKSDFYLKMFVSLSFLYIFVSVCFFGDFRRLLKKHSTPSEADNNHGGKCNYWLSAITCDVWVLAFEHATFLKQSRCVVESFSLVWR